MNKDMKDERNKGEKAEKNGNLKGRGEGNK